MVAVVDHGMREEWPSNWSPKIKKVAELIGVDIYPTSANLLNNGSATAGQWFCGDQQRIYIQPCISDWMILHDIGHWIAASPWDRKKDNFGLDNLGTKRARWRWARADKVEIDACKIHMALMKGLGFSRSAIKRNADEMHFTENNINSPVANKSDKAKKAYVRRLVAYGFKLLEQRAPKIYEYVK